MPASSCIVIKKTSSIVRLSVHVKQRSLWIHVLYNRTTRCFWDMIGVSLSLWFFRVWAILCTQSLQQRHQPAQNFWVYSEFLGFFVLYSRPLADFLSQLGKWVKLIKGAQPCTSSSGQGGGKRVLEDHTVACSLGANGEKVWANSKIRLF